MKTILLVASLLLAQDAAPTTILRGRIALDDGSPLPTVETFRGSNVNFALQASVPGIPARVGVATLGTDGSFVLPLSLAGGAGEFAIVATRVPLDFYVKSINYGTADLLRGPLTVISTSASTEIQIVLTKTPPAGTRGGFKVSGRVTNWGAISGPLVVSLQSTSAGVDGVSMLHTDNTNVRVDGTFEISGVPRGNYSSRIPQDSGQFLRFSVVDRDVSGLEITLATPGAASIGITNSPFGLSDPEVRPSPLEVTGSRVPLLPPPGSGMVFISQSGRSSWREGALSFFRIEPAGIPLEEKRLENAPLVFTLAPGSYVLRGYSRACDGNCAYVAQPVADCTLPFMIASGQVLYAERVLQNSTCIFRFNSPPR